MDSANKCAWFKHDTRFKGMVQLEILISALRFEPAHHLIGGSVTGFKFIKFDFRSNIIHSLKYQRFTMSGCKVIIGLEFVAKNRLIPN